MKRVRIKADYPEPPICETECSEVEVYKPKEEDVVKAINEYIENNQLISACIEASSSALEDDQLTSVFYACNTLNSVEYRSNAASLLFSEAYDLLKAKLSQGNKLCQRVCYMI